MSKILKKINKVNTPLNIYLLRFSNGMRLISFVLETKKHFHLYHPMMLSSVEENGKKGLELVNFQSPQIVDTPNTIVSKKDCMVFQPTDEFKLHYVNTISNPSAPKKQKQVKKSVDNSSNNVIQFSNFRKYQANTPDPPEVA